MERAPDGHVYLITKHAAAAFGVDHSTISNWKRRGLLAPAYVVDGRPLYRYADLARAELAAREAAVRTSGSAKRVVRRGKLQNAPAAEPAQAPAPLWTPPPSRRTPLLEHPPSREA